ncbi:MAG: hypothetical protein ABIA02_00850 [Candidatus Falkowbacteria bacterium]
MDTLTDEIIKRFNTWKFKQAQPYRLDEIKKVISDSVNRKKPIPLFGYWGIGDKDKIDINEIKTLDYFSQFISTINEVYPKGFRVFFILSDIHAKNNCIPDDKIKEYIKSLKPHFKKNKIKTILLSKILKKNNLSLSMIEQDANSRGNNWWKKFPLRATLIKQVENVSLCDDKNKCAMNYAVMRILESKILEKKFKDQIFITYSSPRLNLIYPNMPTLYLYSTKKGCGEAPWFNNVF